MDELSKIGKIVEINEYLKSLKVFENDLLIIFAVKDTPGNHFKKETVNLMNEIGLKTNLNDKNWHSYIGILDKGNAIVDKISVGLESMVVEDLNINPELTLNVFSSVYVKENTSVIMINGWDYSPDKRGINIVVYSYLNGTVIDAVTFDTHVSANSCQRGRNNNSIPSGMKYTIGYHLLNKKLDSIIETIKRNN